MLQIYSFGSFALDTLTSLEPSLLLEVRAYRVYRFRETKGSVEATAAIQAHVGLVALAANGRYGRVKAAARCSGECERSARLQKLIMT